MDTKKTLNRFLAVICLMMLSAASVFGQNIKEIKFCDKKYEKAIGKDSVTLFFNMLDPQGHRISNVSVKEVDAYLVVKEDGEDIPNSNRRIFAINSGQRIPSEYTFSVLIDQTISNSGKQQILKVVEKLVESAPNGCVYISFFGDEVSNTELLTRDNIGSFRDQFNRTSEKKCFYGALYAKLAEFSKTEASLEKSVIAQNYVRNAEISKRAAENADKNILFVFTEGSIGADDQEEIQFMEVRDYQAGTSNVIPTVYAFYYIEEGQDVNIASLLQAVCNPNASGRVGAYKPANAMDQIISDFEEVVNDQMYDFAFTYRVKDGKLYKGNTTYEAVWKGDVKGESTFDIGSKEEPWPLRSESAADTALKYLYAIIATLLTMAFFFFVMKIIIPLIQSKSFEVKYYKKYIPEANVNRRICYYCKQPIVEGQMIVNKCEHIMHVHCWQQNGYKCAEYGQKCKTGIQKHIEWSELWTMSSLKSCHQTMAGILAGFISWIFYEIAGHGGFDGLAGSIVNMCYTPDEGYQDLTPDCIGKVSAFLTIGLLLGFFLSMIFRYNDEYRKKDWKILLKIVGLSLLTGLIGMLTFAFGAMLLCWILSAIDTTYIPWYCSFPAYMLFSVCVTLALTIQSSIPLKSAFIGGSLSSLIGFLVLYFSSFAGEYNMLLNFIIYGGGLGASLVTVRMLAEKYFLVIMNGVRAKQRIPIHKWMGANGGGKVSIGMTGECEIQMNWEKSNRVAKEHVKLYVDPDRQLPMLKPLATGVIYNMRAELPVGRPCVLTNGDTIKIGETIFKYEEND